MDVAMDQPWFGSEPILLPDKYCSFTLSTNGNSPGCHQGPPMSPSLLNFTYEFITLVQHIPQGNDHTWIYNSQWWWKFQVTASGGSTNAEKIQAEGQGPKLRSESHQNPSHWCDHTSESHQNPSHKNFITNNLNTQWVQNCPALAESIQNIPL